LNQQGTENGTAKVEMQFLEVPDAVVAGSSQKGLKTSASSATIQVRILFFFIIKTA